MELAPPRPDRASAVGRRAACRDPHGGTCVAGEDRWDLVSRLVLRQGRAADRHRTSYADRRGEGRAGRFSREAPAYPRLSGSLWATAHGVYGPWRSTGHGGLRAMEVYGPWRST